MFGGEKFGKWIDSAIRVITNLVWQITDDLSNSLNFSPAKLCVYAFVRVYMCVLVYVYMCMCVRMCVCMCKCVCLCTEVHSTS